jgi:hypothetical protein
MGQESWCGQLAQFGFELSMVVGAGRKTNFVSSLPFPKFLPELAMRTAQSTEKVQAARAAFQAALSGSNHKASGSAGGYLLFKLNHRIKFSIRMFDMHLRVTKTH